MVPFQRAIVTSYRPSIVTSPLSLPVSEILPLLCSSTPFFPTPPLISPKFPHVPLGVGGRSLGYEEWRCWAMCPCNYFRRFPTYVILIHQRHRQTDRQTDGQTARRTTCNLNTALCTSASRGKNVPSVVSRQAWWTNQQQRSVCRVFAGINICAQTINCSFLTTQTYQRWIWTLIDYTSRVF